MTSRNVTLRRERLILECVREAGGRVTRSGLLGIMFPSGSTGSEESMTIQTLDGLVKKKRLRRQQIRVRSVVTNVYEL